MKHVPDLEQVKQCSSAYVLALKETMNILNGKWKLPILGKLQFGKLRFRELERAIVGFPKVHRFESRVPSLTSNQPEQRDETIQILRNADCSCN